MPLHSPAGGSGVLGSWCFLVKVEKYPCALPREVGSCVAVEEPMVPNQTHLPPSMRVTVTWSLGHECQSAGSATHQCLLLGKFLRV